MDELAAETGVLRGEGNGCWPSALSPAWRAWPCSRWASSASSRRRRPMTNRPARGRAGRGRRAARRSRPTADRARRTSRRAGTAGVGGARPDRRPDRRRQRRGRAVERARHELPGGGRLGQRRRPGRGAGEVRDRGRAGRRWKRRPPSTSSAGPMPVTPSSSARWARPCSERHRRHHSLSPATAAAATAPRTRTAAPRRAIADRSSCPSRSCSSPSASPPQSPGRWRTRPHRTTGPPRNESLQVARDEVARADTALAERPGRGRVRRGVGPSDAAARARVRQPCRTTAGHQRAPAGDLPRAARRARSHRAGASPGSISSSTRPTSWPMSTTS